MLCLKKRRTYSFTQGACTAFPRRSKKDNNRYEESLNMAITTLPRKNSCREKRPSRMVLTVTEDTPADMLAGSMELLVQLPRDHHLHTQRVTVLRNTPMMDLLVQIATAHKLTASSYTLQAIGERGLVLPHHPNTPIGALDALQVKLLPKQGTCVPRKTKQTNQPFETTFRLQVHLPRNQLYVSRVSPKMNLGEILDEVCREKNLDRNKYELRHPANLEETLDLALSLRDYHLQEVTLYAKQARTLGPTLSTQDIMALQRQEERRRQQTKQSVFGFMFKKSKESSVSTDSLGGRSVSPARSDETGRSASPLQPPVRTQRKRRPAPKPPADAVAAVRDTSDDNGKDKMVINHSRNSSDSSGYHEASVLSDNPDSAARLPETLPRRSKAPGTSDNPRKLAQTSHSSKSLGNLAATDGTLSRGISSTSLSSTGLRKKRAAPPPPAPRPLSSAISTQALERIVDSEESLTSDMDPSKPPSDIGAPSKASSDIDCPKANSDIGVSTQSVRQLDYTSKADAAMCESDSNVQQICAVKTGTEARSKSDSIDRKLDKADSEVAAPVEAVPRVEQARVAAKKVGECAPLPLPRKISPDKNVSKVPPKAPKRKVVPLPSIPPVSSSTEHDSTNDLSRERISSEDVGEACSPMFSAPIVEDTVSLDEDALVICIEKEQVHSKSRNERESSDKDKSNQQEKILTVGDVIMEDDISIKSSPGDKVKSNLHSDELHRNSIESIHVKAEETHSIFNEKSSNEYKLNQEKIMPDNADDNLENHKTPILNRHLSQEEVVTKSELDSYLVEQDLCDIKSKNEENNFTKQNYEVKSEYIHLCDDNDNNSYILLNNVSLNDNMIKPDCTIERRTSEQANLSHDQRPERPPRVSRKMVFTRESEENTAAAKHVHSEDAMSDDTVKNNIEKDKETCTVISMIPKCEHFDTIKEARTLNITTECSVTLTDHQLNKHSQVNGTTVNTDELFEKHQQNDDQNDEPNNTAKNTKRTRIVRSQSKLEDYETDSSKRQKRYLTSPSVDIVHALNLSLPLHDSMPFDTPEMKWERIDAEQSTNRTMDVDIDKGKSYGELITAKEDTPLDTDTLLQKVSDTLSSALPVSSSASSPEPSPFEYAVASVPTNDADMPNDPAGKKEPIETKNESNETYRSCIDFPADIVLSTSTPNTTPADSQQNTSVYVSAAMGDDLSISDWEYQLPAPPSAFRDSYSPIFNDYDTITLGSVEAFKQSLIHPVSETTSDTTDNCERKNIESSKNLLNVVDGANFSRTVSNERTDVVSEAEIDIKGITNKPIVKRTSSISHKKTETNLDTRKEIISELENKIETGTLAQTINKDFDRRNMDNVSAPRIAPVDNTLSNFTITTYTKQKSLDIFDECEETVDYTRNSDERFIKTFATLSRSNANMGNHDNRSAMTNAGCLTNSMLSYGKKTNGKLEGTNADCKIEPKIRNQGEPSHRWQSLSASNEKVNVQRSKSYISMSSNAKYQTEAQVTNERKCESRVEPEIVGMKRATSITGLNVDMPRNNEKVSQWRNNILKRQEEPTKEKELQSLQVLKSILPQLKNAQQAEENVSKEYNSILSIEKTRYEAESNEHSIKTNVVPTRESRDLEAGKQPPREESIKRYTYAGPPAISLGSWSERPNVNVQIKMDTDYKLGRSNVSGNKTIVCINGEKEEISKNNITKHEAKIGDSLTNKNSDEITKKLITHTTASGFKKLLSNRINASIDSTRDEDKPVVTGVELKKTFIETKETSKNSENEIDITPVNFKELTKTFGQHVNFKLKPKRSNINRHSVDYYDGQSNEIGRIVDSSIKQNGHAKFATLYDQNDFSFKNQPLTNGDQQNLRIKKFTSIVGVNGTSQNFLLQNKTFLNTGQRNVNNITKINPPMPVVKGFKVPSNDSRISNGQTNHNGLSTADGIRKDVQPPKPPTMPVITGVTLKSASARPKSMSAQIDPRDMLLESIRNFGGREKLKSTAERY